MGTGQKKFEDAQEDCETLGGFLAEPRSAAINDYLKSFNLMAWIGTTDNETEGTWVWETDGANVSWTGWAPNKPTNLNGKQHCAMLDPAVNYDWNDRSCGIN